LKFYAEICQFVGVTEYLHIPSSLESLRSQMRLTVLARFG